MAVVGFVLFVWYFFWCSILIIWSFPLKALKNRDYSSERSRNQTITMHVLAMMVACLAMTLFVFAPAAICRGGGEGHRSMHRLSQEI